MRLLVEQGANIDLQTGASKGNMTALALAAEQGHLKIVKTLIELGAAPDGKGILEIPSGYMKYLGLRNFAKEWIINLSK